ncbi:hypothetical protein GCM10009632_51570 [Mycolicibacterium alvei]|uniref:Uncharacterized protein n=1 Tax=Mycolicibacterium alvei TaxID=67081 RepID=A0A6N4V1H5_9MYCO|nr:hypothetical protein MALV_52800 [Mycolicibacterium alvei]
MDQRGEQAVLVAEVVVERADTDPGLAGEAPHGKLLHAVNLDEDPRSVEDMSTCALLDPRCHK